MNSKLILERIERIEVELQELKLVVEADAQRSPNEATGAAQYKDSDYTLADLAGAFPEFAGLSFEDIKAYEYKSKLLDS